MAQHSEIKPIAVHLTIVMDCFATMFEFKTRRTPLFIAEPPVLQHKHASPSFSSASHWPMRESPVLLTPSKSTYEAFTQRIRQVTGLPSSPGSERQTAF
jgi:hypothetical protein